MPADAVPAAAPVTTTAAPAAAPAAAGGVAAPPAAEPNAAPEAPKAEGELGNLIADAKADPETKPAEEPTKPLELGDLKVPEGVKADDPLLASFAADAKEVGLSGKQAQALLDKYGGKLVPAEALQQHVDAQTKLWKDTQQQWQAEVRSDPEVGGPNLPANLARIAKVIDTVGGDAAPAIKQAFNLTGAGNNPAIVRFLHKLAGQIHVEGDTVRAGGPSTITFKTASERLYGGKTES